MTDVKPTPELEKAARALFAHDKPDIAHLWDQWGSEGRAKYVARAAAVIRSLLPPTEAMVEAGRKAISSEMLGRDPDAAEAADSGIRAALRTALGEEG